MSIIHGPWNPGEPDPTSDRLPPRNYEAEAGVLGSIILEPDKFKEVRAVLRGPGDFFRDAHQTIYRVLCELADAGAPIDALTLGDELARQGETTEVGGIETIAEIVGNVPHSANAAYYAGIVRDKAVARELIEAASEILRDAYSNQFAADALLLVAKRKVARVGEGVKDHTWQPPELDAAHPAVAFPLDVFPEGLQRFVREVCGSIPCPPDFVAVPALAVAGAAIGRSVSLRVKASWHEEGNLWAAIVGKPGSAKTPALKSVCKPLYKIMEDQLHVHQIEVELLKQRKRDMEAERKKVGGKSSPGVFPDDQPPALKRVVVGDATSEALGLRLRDNPRGLILVLDELAGLINGLNQYKNGGGNDQEFYLALWSRASYPIDRKGQEGGIPIYVRSPFFAATGGIQPDKLNSIGTTKDGRRLNDGFIDRFLFAFPAEIAMRWTWDSVSPESEAEWGDAVKRLWNRPMVAQDDGYERPFFLDLSPEARERYAAWFDENCIATEESDFPDEMKGPFSKARAYCARLALVVEHLWWAFDPTGPDAPTCVSLRSVEAAIRLVAYFDAHYRRVMAFIGGNGGENPDARAIMTWLETRDEPTFRLSNVKNNFRRRFESNPEALPAAMAWLEERGIVRKLADRHSPGRGKPPSPTFEINPTLRKRAPFTTYSQEE